MVGFRFAEPGREDCYHSRCVHTLISDINHSDSLTWQLIGWFLLLTRSHDRDLLHCSSLVSCEKQVSGPSLSLSLSLSPHYLLIPWFRVLTSSLSAVMFYLPLHLDSFHALFFSLSDFSFPVSHLHSLLLLCCSFIPFPLSFRIWVLFLCLLFPFDSFSCY